MRQLQEDLQIIQHTTNMAGYFVGMINDLLRTLEDPIFTQNKDKDWIKPIVESLVNDWEGVKENTEHLPDYFEQCDIIVEEALWNNWPPAREIGEEKVAEYHQIKA
ncbi:Oidioi.mRNA.OKI2018_I69.PAR.g13230.t1.cds [Oikopleura dioica]|uniref:Oidioi.mRNA.OKI2018_I69.PAR.g13230.t1.cds n=1 Tax=Oikopleura dioica TaxID=34765 RepID=A0ABN7S5H3_OIKDI|nr:Oidioi.mRNA.OKI2018_I69.PAR.g13230.t1.cds [Oikopleura dioica]